VYILFACLSSLPLLHIFYISIVYVNIADLLKIKSMCPIVATTLQSSLAGIVYYTYLRYSMFGQYKLSEMYEGKFVNISGNKWMRFRKSNCKCELFHVFEHYVM